LSNLCFCRVSGIEEDLNYQIVIRSRHIQHFKIENDSYQRVNGFQTGLFGKPLFKDNCTTQADPKSKPKIAEKLQVCSFYHFVSVTINNSLSFLKTMQRQCNPYDETTKVY
jgi:hypothetical protein